MTDGADGVVPAGDEQQAAAVYRERIVAVENGRLSVVLANLIELVAWAFPDTWTGPRFRILVCREDADDGVGVRVAGTKRRARRALAEVEDILAASTVAEARTALNLDF